MLSFKGYLPLPLSPTPRSKRELGQPLLSRERTKLRGRGKGKGVRQRNGIHPYTFFLMIILTEFKFYILFVLHLKLNCNFKAFSIQFINPLGLTPAVTGFEVDFPDNAEKSLNYSVIFDHTDKSNTSFKSVRGLLLFVYTDLKRVSKMN